MHEEGGRRALKMVRTRTRIGTRGTHHTVSLFDVAGDSGCMHARTVIFVVVTSSATSLQVAWASFSVYARIR